MLSKALLSTLLLSCGVSNVSAFWRMQCNQPIVTDRVDPLAQYGVYPAKHVHNIMGGSAFNKDATFDSLQTSKCTSCEVKGDKSSYWVPALYFQRSSDGLFEQVAQKAGMLVYYIPERGRPNVDVFPPNFVMLAGDPHLRNFTDSDTTTEAYRRQAAIGFNCLNYDTTPEGFAANKHMPDPALMKTCVNGLRADITFPSCWDGRTDSHDHRSHMAYPDQVEDGVCPPTHPKRLITMKFETLFDVAPYSDVDGQFVWSTGDPTGYGYHGDFMNGWDLDLLKAAVADDTCVPPITLATGGVIENCMTFINGNQLQSPYDMMDCTIPPVGTGNFTGPSQQLAGCNPVQAGPQYATECQVDNAGTPETTASIIAPPTATSSITPTTYSTPASVKTRSRKKHKPSTIALPSSTIPALEVAGAHTPAPTVTANPLVHVENQPDVAAVKEVVVTVVETITQTVWDAPATKTVSAYRHARRHGHRHGSF